jgi:Protein of unknown function (DUF1566)
MKRFAAFLVSICMLNVGTMAGVVHAAGQESLPATGAKKGELAISGLTPIQGEDGVPAYGAALPYKDNADGTITDENTKLMWEKKDGLDGVPSTTDLHDADNQYPFNGYCGSLQGTEFCGTNADCANGQSCVTPTNEGPTIFQWVAELNAAKFAGYQDWRIPNVKELYSIYDADPEFVSDSIPGIAPTLEMGVAPVFYGTDCSSSCTDLTNPACSCTAPQSYWSSTRPLTPEGLVVSFAQFINVTGSIGENGGPLAPVRAWRCGQ